MEGIEQSSITKIFATEKKYIVRRLYVLVLNKNQSCF